jgi:hypothetical protein
VGWRRTLAYAGIATEPNGQGIGTRAHNFSPAQKHGNKSARKTDEHEGDAGTPGCWAVGANSNALLKSTQLLYSICSPEREDGIVASYANAGSKGRLEAWRFFDCPLHLPQPSHAIRCIQRAAVHQASPREVVATNEQLGNGRISQPFLGWLPWLVLPSPPVHRPVRTAEARIPPHAMPDEEHVKEEALTRGRAHEIPSVGLIRLRRERFVASHVGLRPVAHKRAVEVAGHHSERLPCKVQHSEER